MNPSGPKKKIAGGAEPGGARRNVNRNKSARQIEILSLVEKNPGSYSIADLCEIFGVEVATLNRDLNELRGMGYDIHSSKKQLTLLASLTEDDYRELLSVYLTSVSGIISFPKNVSLTAKQLQDRTLEVFAALVHAIEQRERIVISYVRLHDQTASKYKVEPYDIIPANRDWRLIVRSGKIFKQFIIGNIKEVVSTGENFERIGDFSTNDYYAGSFGFFSGGTIFEAELEFDGSVAALVRNRIWTEGQEIIESEDGIVVLRMKVNSIEEVGNWVLSWGSNVFVRKPAELREHVLGKARGILQMSEKKGR